MAWCEANDVSFLFGLQKNERLVAEIASELAQAETKSRRTGKPARSFKEFRWRTRHSWSCERRVVAKAECTGGEAHPRFVVTSVNGPRNLPTCGLPKFPTLAGGGDQPLG
jgi:Transposase DDE domain group 1